MAELLLILLIIPFLILILICCWRRQWVRIKYRELCEPLLSRENNFPSLKYRAECYGQGNIHQDIQKQIGILTCGGNSLIPCILFVYKVSRETEDLRNALQWLQAHHGIQKNNICAVILLEKVSGNHDKLVDVDHQGVFNDTTVVVRMLWEEQWSKSKVQMGPKNQEAMAKVIQSLRMWH